MKGLFLFLLKFPLPVVTAPGGLGEFDIVFSPLVDSLYFGSMTITSNQGDIVVNLSGRGFDGVYREAFGRLGRTLMVMVT